MTGWAAAGRCRRPGRPAGERGRQRSLAHGRPVVRHDSARTEDGSIGLLMAVLASAMIAFAGLVIDGGAALAARQLAADVAQQAARAGADALDYSTLRQNAPGGLRADPAAAAAAAQRVLAAAEATGQVQVAGTTVTVTARIEASTVVLSAFGLNDLSQSASWSADALEGVDSGG